MTLPICTFSKPQEVVDAADAKEATKAGEGEEKDTTFYPGLPRVGKGKRKKKTMLVRCRNGEDALWAKDGGLH